MNDPIAYFLTWPTYGTWLSGDERGWVDYGRGWQPPDPAGLLESQARMTETACWLTVQERELVEAQVKETCAHRRWTLHAVNCRSNHMHVVVSAPGVEPKKIRTDLKAWCTRRLKEQSDPRRENWWAERGSIRPIFDDVDLANAVEYTLEAQDRKGRE
jgi:REP element-mobilizing transposase RayT